MSEHTRIKIVIEDAEEGLGRIIVTGDWTSVNRILSLVLGECENPQEILDSLERSIERPLDDQV